MRQTTLFLLLSFASLTFCQEVVDWSSLVDKVSPAVVTPITADTTFPTAPLKETLDSISIFNEALQVARSIGDENWQSEALRYVAEGMAKAGQFQQELQVAKSIEHSYWRAEALCSVAKAMAKAGMKEQFQTVLEQALQAAKSIGIKHVFERLKTLVKIAIAMLSGEE